MNQFDLDKLEKAIVYAERMAEGKAPYSNLPVDDEVLNNPNVIRSMYFIKDVLQAVKDNGGCVVSKKSNTNAASKFPFECLEQFRYEANKPISYVLKQFVELTGDPNTKIISASAVNKWLASKGYLSKAVINDEGTEHWIPTETGEALGLIAVIRKGEFGREYVRIEYNKEAQEFLAKNLKQITEDWMAEKK